MRLSPKRHTLAILRTTIGLTQRDMAELAECSPPTIQAIELGKLKMSERLGALIQRKTGVNLGWLLGNDVTQPPVNTRNEPYTRQTFEEVQAWLSAPPADLDDAFQRQLYVRGIFLKYLDRLRILLVHSYRNNSLAMCDYKLDEALNSVLEYQNGTKNLNAIEGDGWKRAGMRRSLPKDLLAEVRRFVDEIDAIFQTQMAERDSLPMRGKYRTERAPIPADLLLELKKREAMERREKRLESAKAPKSRPAAAGKGMAAGSRSAHASTAPLKRSVPPPRA